MPVSFTIIIPARHSSSRLPGKPLCKIAGKTLAEHAYNSAIRSEASDTIIATDDERIADEVSRFNAKCVLTGQDLASGTDRVNEAAAILKLPTDQIIVNLPVDEFNCDPGLINEAAHSLASNDAASMSTLCRKTETLEELQNRNTVKVVLDKYGYALYFSRSVIPSADINSKESSNNSHQAGLKHLGIYSYRTDFLRTYSNLPRPEIEKQESLEQLRALFHGYKIYVKQVDKTRGIQINTEKDLENARQRADSLN